MFKGLVAVVSARVFVDEALRQGGVARLRVESPQLTEKLYDRARRDMVKYTRGEAGRPFARTPFFKECYMALDSCRRLAEIPEPIQAARYIVGPKYADDMRLWGVSLVNRNKGDRQRVHSDVEHWPVECADESVGVSVTVTGGHKNMSSPLKLLAGTHKTGLLADELIGHMMNCWTAQVWYNDPNDTDTSMPPRIYRRLDDEKYCVNPPSDEDVYAAAIKEWPWLRLVEGSKDTFEGHAWMSSTWHGVKYRNDRKVVLYQFATDRCLRHMRVPNYPYDVRRRAFAGDWIESVGYLKSGKLDLDSAGPVISARNCPQRWKYVKRVDRKFQTPETPLDDSWKVKNWTTASNIVVESGLSSSFGPLRRDFSGAFEASKWEKVVETPHLASLHVSRRVTRRSNGPGDYMSYDTDDLCVVLDGTVTRAVSADGTCAATQVFDTLEGEIAFLMSPLHHAYIGPLDYEYEYGISAQELCFTLAPKGRSGRVSPDDRGVRQLRETPLVDLPQAQLAAVRAALNGPNRLRGSLMRTATVAIRRGDFGVDDDAVGKTPLVEVSTVTKTVAPMTLPHTSSQRKTARTHAPLHILGADEFRGYAHLTARVITLGTQAATYLEPHADVGPDGIDVILVPLVGTSLLVDSTKSTPRFLEPWTFVIIPAGTDNVHLRSAGNTPADILVVEIIAAT